MLFKLINFKDNQINLTKLYFDEIKLHRTKKTILNFKLGANIRYNEVSLIL